jgi:hypothetical protein
LEKIFLSKYTYKYLQFLLYFFCPATGSYKKSSDNPWFYLWVIASIISSCYAYTWDIKMDWGLFDQKAGDNQFLREEIVYSSTVSET